MKGVAWAPFFFTVVLQCLLESSLLLSAGLLIQRYCPKHFFTFYIALSTLLVLAHEVDFVMIRLMGVTIWYLIHLIALEMGDNFIEMIKATNISAITWFLGACGVFAIFFSSRVLYHLSEKLSQKRKLHLSQNILIALLVAPLIVLIVWDKVTLCKLSSVSYEQFRQILPFKKTFFLPKQFLLPIEPALKEIQLLDSSSLQTACKRPPIYLFVIESLREDYITNEIAPNMFRFKQDNISFDIAASGGNASHLSWFTLFHSEFPLRFSKKHIEKISEKGSLPLQTLKEMGYQIHLYTSAELAFYHMGESIFGKQYQLADSRFEYPHGGKIPSCTSDQKVFEEIEKDKVRFEGDGHAFIIFLDATHFGYSWPKEMGNRFLPIEEPIDYIKAAFNKGPVEEIKNRYRNSIYYVDSLIGKFLEGHKEDDAVIVLTGDHGEEFYEEGQIFHASNLSDAQIHIPLYYRFGQESAELKERMPKISSHIDIFPTLIDYISGTQRASLEGESIFKKDRWPYALTARYNGGKPPFEFCLQSLTGKVVLQNLTKGSLKVTSVTSSESSQFLTETKEAFSHLFTNTKN